MATPKYLYGLIGYQLNYSFSKKYFAEKFEKEKIQDSHYDNFALENIDEFPALLKANPNLAGLNVTIPYKEKVISFLDKLAPAAEEIGAVNTIKFEDGKLIGYNTDVIGFETSLKAFFERTGIVPKAALILGTGGAAKAIAYVLKKNNISYDFVSRKKRAHKLTYEEIDRLKIENIQLIVNTTPLGTAPDVHRCPPISYNQLSDKHLLYDLVYNPDKTVFLKMGEAQKCAIQNGYQMLELQAEASYIIWHQTGN